MNKPPGRILTFYSYKGGAGRSMALANVAWTLATEGKSVLVIDWDLEAPGLHRYFAPFLIDKDFTASDGLIDFLVAYASEAVKPSAGPQSVSDDWYVPYAERILDYAVSAEWDGFPTNGRLDIIPAGRQGPSYAVRVTSFDWKNLYDRLGGYKFLEAAKIALRNEYDYVLIDSRTGVSDTAGVCTVQFADSLVVFFTLNNQSIEGAAAVALSAFAQRTAIDSTSDEPTATNATAAAFDVFPVPTRVDASEKHKLEDRWRLMKERFVGFPKALPSDSERETYWQRVMVPHVPYYAFEEILAPFGNRRDDPLQVNLLATTENLVRFVTGIESQSPDISDQVRNVVLDLYAGRSSQFTPIGARHKDIEDAKRREIELNEREQTIIASAKRQITTEYEESISLAERARRTWRRASVALGLILLIGMFGGFYRNRLVERELSVMQDAEQRRISRLIELMLAADTAAASGNIAAAISGYSDALRLSADKRSTGEILIKRGELYQRVESIDGPDLERAMTDFSEAIATDPGNLEAYRKRGGAYLQMGRFQEAKEDFDRVVEADPRDTTALFNRGLALDRLGKREEAISDYGLVLDFEPQDADALLARGNILRDLRRTAEAIRDLKGAVDIAPTSAAASAARVILKDLGAADQVDREAKSLTGKAILHYIDAGDRVTIDILERTLRDEGIVVPRKELVPERVISGDVRYFYRGDLDMAVRAKQIVERALAKSGVRLTLDIKFLDANNIRFRSAPTGQIEIWLPSLSQAVNVRG